MDSLSNELLNTSQTVFQMRILGVLESLLKGVMYLLFKVHFQTSTVRSPTDPFAVLQRCAELYEALWKPTEFYRSPTEPTGSVQTPTELYGALRSPTEPHGAEPYGALQSPTNTCRALPSRREFSRILWSPGAQSQKDCQHDLGVAKIWGGRSISPSCLKVS